MAQTVPTTQSSNSPHIVKPIESKREIEFIPLTNINRDRLSPISYLPRPTGNKISLRNTHGAQSSTETSGIGTALSSFDMSFEFDQDPERSPRTPERDRRRISPRRADSFEQSEQFRGRRRSPPKRGDSCDLPTSGRSGSPIGPPEFLNQQQREREHVKGNRRHSPEPPTFFQYNKPTIFKITGPSQDEDDRKPRRSDSRESRRDSTDSTNMRKRSGSKDGLKDKKGPELRRSLSKDEKERSESLERRCPGRGTPEHQQTPEYERKSHWTRSPERQLRSPESARSFEGHSRTRTPLSERSDSRTDFRRGEHDRRMESPNRDYNNAKYSGSPTRSSDRDPRRVESPTQRDTRRERRSDSPTKARADSRHAADPRGPRRTEPPRTVSPNYNETRGERRQRRSTGDRPEPGAAAGGGSTQATDNSRPPRSAGGATSYTEDTIEVYPDPKYSTHPDSKYHADSHYQKDPKRVDNVSSSSTTKPSDSTETPDRYRRPRDYDQRGTSRTSVRNRDLDRDESGRFVDRQYGNSEYREPKEHPINSAYSEIHKDSAFAELDREPSAYHQDQVVLRNRERPINRDTENRDSGFYRDFDAEMSDNRGFLNVDGERNDPNDLIDYGEFNKRRGSRTPSPCPSPRLSRSGSTRGSRRKSFLGIETNSTWVKWSQARRNSFQNRIKQIEQHEKTREQSKAKLPIKKARMESSRFLNPDEEVHSDEEVLPKPKKKKSKAKKDKNEPVQPKPRKKIRLTEKQWQILIDFWENQHFVRSRICGILFSLVAVTLGIIALATENWSDFKALDGKTTARMGMFLHCDTENITAPASADLTFADLKCETLVKYAWQKAVIGLFLFAVSFGFLATILSVCGLCVNNLPRKLYYYHSAGEIFFVCALSCTFSLVAYPICIEKEGLPKHNYGYSYMLAWAATTFFYASCFCMMLDDVIHATSTRGCLCCCGKKKTNDSTQSV